MPTRDNNLVEKIIVECKTKLFKIIKLYSGFLYNWLCVVATAWLDGNLNIILVILNAWWQLYYIIL